MRELIERFSPFVEPDEYGETTVYSLYYDTPDKRIIRKSIEKPPFKEKLRIRKYGNKKGGNVFVELKRKVDGVVYKRRIEMPESVAFNYLKGEEVAFDGQIKREIDYFISFYNGLIPSTMISCERLAFKNDETELRVTFDKNIRYRTCDFAFGSSKNDILINENSVLMEIKTPYAIPIEIAQILSKHKLYKRSFSKCGEAYIKQITKNQSEVNKVG
jgi:hypothetical protein